MKTPELQFEEKLLIFVVVVAVVPFMGGNSIILGLYCGDIKSFVGSLN